MPFVLATPLKSSLSKAQSCTNRALKQDEDKTALFCRSAELLGRCIFAPPGPLIAHAQVSARQNDGERVFRGRPRPPTGGPAARWAGSSDLRNALSRHMGPSQIGPALIWGQASCAQGWRAGRCRCPTYALYAICSTARMRWRHPEWQK